MAPHAAAGPHATATGASARTGVRRHTRQRAGATAHAAARRAASRRNARAAKRKRRAKAKAGRAGTRRTTLAGQVVGTPYEAARGRTAVPVLLSAANARRAHLRTPVGIVLIHSTLALPIRSGSHVQERIRARELRIGDRFAAAAKVTRRVQRSLYPRMPITRVRVTKRVTPLSTTELQTLVRRLQTQLTQARADISTISAAGGRTAAGLAALSAATKQGFADVNARVSALGAATRTALADLDTRVHGLRADVDRIDGQLAQTRSQLGDLHDLLTQTTDGLGTQIDQVRSDLQPQVTAVLGQVTSLAGQLGDCDEETSVIGTVCALQAQIDALDIPDVSGLTGRVDQVSGALTEVVGLLTGQTLSGDLSPSLTPTVATLLGGFAGLQDTVGSLTTQLGGLDATMGLLIGPSGALGTTSDPLGNLLATLDLGTLQTQVGSVSDEVGNLLALLQSTDGGQTSGALDAILGRLDGLDTLTGTTAATLASTTTALTSRLDGLDTLTASLGTSLSDTTDTLTTTLQGVCTGLATQLKALRTGLLDSTVALVGSLLEALFQPGPVPTEAAIDGACAGT